MISLRERIFGSLAGLVLADALGASFEGMPRDQVRASFRDKFSALDHALNRPKLRFTDDGQMTLAVAEYLTLNSKIVSEQLMLQFVESYESWRGYGRGTIVLIEAFRDHAEYEYMAEHLFPGGSLGNGAAMRSAPVGLRFLGHTKTIWQEAKASSWPTHRHELGIEGAQLISMATSIAASHSEITPSILAEQLLPLSSSTIFQNRLEKLRNIRDEMEIEVFGNGIEAHESVVTALACFSLHSNDFRSAIATALWQGGDTDTIAAMTGALVGAHVGSNFIEPEPLSRLEEGESFIQYLNDLADRLSNAS